MATTTNETFAFQAEINQLLSLIINTFYSNKDVFLRELVSNASDALDKLRYKSITDQSVKQDLCIRIQPDTEANILTIRDYGIGMTKEELIQNLGTIAHSGTKAFMESLANGSADMSLIGQFGVGFYSAFLVADKVRVTSKSVENQNEVWVWESNAGGTFHVSKEEIEGEFPIGTEIQLHLKEDQKQYLEEHKLTDIITKHSQYISFPIYLHVQREEEVPVVDDTKNEEGEQSGGEKSEKDEEGKVEDVKEDTEDDKEKKTITQKVNKWEHLNKQQPLWTRKSEQVTHEEYALFYKSVYGDWEDHLAVKHFAAEGQIEFKALLYIPSRAPFDMFNGGVAKKMNNIKLYVRKVLIMDETNELLPEYLSFVKGIVDSDDLPLNVSREMLQQNNVMKLIKKNLVKKIIDMMSELSENPEKWQKFYENFNKNIKLGIIEDSKSADKLKELLRFNSLNALNSSNDMISLDTYIEKMKEGQKDIYFVTGESVAVMKDMPCLERLKKKGYDVLFMSDPIDEYVMQHMKEYKDKKFVNCTKEDLVLEETDMENLQKEWEPICKHMKEILGEKVKDVKVSDKLVTKPCVLVGDKYGWSANMERIMKAQALKNNDHFMFGRAHKTLEINVDHDIIKAIREKVNAKASVKDAVNLLFETVMIDCGYQVESPSMYCSKIYRLINMGLTGDENNDDCDGDGDVEKEVPETVVENNDISLMEEVD